MSDLSLSFILQSIATAPEALGITAAYNESKLLRYKQYGKYDAIAVKREGKRLLKALAELELLSDVSALGKWQAKYLAWQKKCEQLKFKALVHGEFNEAGKIILYPQAIARECVEHGWNYSAYYTSVLVHERVHVLHHKAVLQKYGAMGEAVQSAAYKKAQVYWFGAGANPACVRTVKETLAEFVRYVWCKEQGEQKLADAVPKALTGPRAFYPNYPYAGVRNLCDLYERDSDIALRAWEKLWQVSLISWQEAYKLLSLGEIH